MNLTEYIHLINKPDAVHDKQTEVLEKIVQEFPYFQSARALYLKGLYNQNSFKYNYTLKIAAAHTADRSVLFDFITSDTFTSVNKELFEQKLQEIASITVRESEVVEPKLEVRENSIEQSILSSIRTADPEPEAVVTESELIAADVTADDFVPKTEVEENKQQPNYIEPEVIATQEAQAETAVEQIAEVTEPIIAIDKSTNETEEESPKPESEVTSEAKLEIGQPLHFEKNERHSFQEWLQLSRFTTIDRSDEATIESPQIVLQVQSPDANNASDNTFSDTESEKQKKNELIDRFIQASPKIPPVKSTGPVAANIIVEPSMSDTSYLMTETLARVYLEQKKFSKAIKAYEILILKYPEKSSFFADRILDIKNLQQNHK